MTPNLHPYKPLRHTEVHSFFSVGDSLNDSCSTYFPHPFPSISILSHIFRWSQGGSRIFLKSSHTDRDCAAAMSDLYVTSAWDSPAKRNRTISCYYHTCLWFPYELQQYQAELAWTTDFQLHIKTARTQSEFKVQKKKDCLENFALEQL